MVARLICIDLIGPLNGTAHIRFALVARYDYCFFACFSGHDDSRSLKNPGNTGISGDTLLLPKLPLLPESYRGS